jgi:hypothetical protein
VPSRASVDAIRLSISLLRSAYVSIIVNMHGARAMHQSPDPKRQAVAGSNTDDVSPKVSMVWISAPLKSRKFVRELHNVFVFC